MHKNMIRCLLVLLLAFAGWSLQAQLYYVSPNSNAVYDLDGATGRDVAFICITADSDAITGFSALARQPKTGRLFTTASIESLPKGQQVLATVDLVTRKANIIGNTHRNFSAIAFDNDGTLYGLGDKCLCIINIESAAVTVLNSLSGEQDGALAFCLGDGMLYRLSGGMRGGLFQTIAVDRSHEENTVALLSTELGKVSALGYLSGQNAFVAACEGGLYRITPSGAIAKISEPLTQRMGKKGKTVRVEMRGLVPGEKMRIGVEGLISADAWNGRLVLVDPATGLEVTSASIAINGDTINGFNGLAMHPQTGKLFALARLGSLPNNQRVLVTIDLNTMHATLIGNTGMPYNAIAFNSLGTLYGLTGQSGAFPASLYTIDTGEAFSIFQKQLTNNGGSHSMAFNLIDAQFYRMQGNYKGLFERIDPTSFVETPIAMSGDPTDDYCYSMTYANEGREGIFYITDGDSLYRMTSSGVITRITPGDWSGHWSKGLVLIDSSAPSETSASASRVFITVTWQDNSNSESGFEIWRSENGGEFVLIDRVGTNVTTYDDTADLGKTHAYVVRNYGIYGFSGFSNVATVNGGHDADKSCGATGFELLLFLLLLGLRKITRNYRKIR